MPFHPAFKSLAVIVSLLLPAGFAHAQDAITLVEDGLVPANGVPDAAPDVYVVQTGDTLWDISTAFLGNPYYWPRLWSINDYITNPHWIYPGNRIVFIPGTEIEPPGISLEGGEGGVREGFVTENIGFEEGGRACGPDIRFDFSYGSRVYRAAAFLEGQREFELLGEVYKARSGMLSLGEHDLIYLKIDDPNALACGDVVSIMRQLSKKVRHPERRRTKYGKMYAVMGEARILHLQDDVAMAEVRTSYADIQRGDVVGPRIPVNVELEVSAPKGSLDGVIIARTGQFDATLAYPEEVVFLDRGKADGVRVGNSFYIVERKDEGVDFAKEDSSLPPSVVARVVVVRVDETTSTGVVVDAARSIVVGNRVTMLVE